MSIASVILAPHLSFYAAEISTFDSSPNNVTHHRQQHWTWQEPHHQTERLSIWQADSAD